MIEADLGFNPEAARIGQYFPERVSDRNPDGLEYLDEAARCIEPLQTNLIDGRDKGRGAAIHNRRFGTVNLDHGVVDAKAGKGRQHVL